MTTEVLKNRPKMPKPNLVMAVFLELGILMMFFSMLPNRCAIIGLVICFLYSYFSATKAAITYLNS